MMQDSCIWILYGKITFDKKETYSLWGSLSSNSEAVNVPLCETDNVSLCEADSVALWETDNVSLWDADNVPLWEADTVNSESDNNPEPPSGTVIACSAEMPGDSMDLKQ